jgi:hypothetical protein
MWTAKHDRRARILRFLSECEGIPVVQCAAGGNSDNICGRLVLWIVVKINNRAFHIRQNASKMCTNTEQANGVISAVVGTSAKVSRN